MREQWQQLKMKFLLGCNMKIVIIEGNELFVGHGDLIRGIFLGRGGGDESSIPLVGETLDTDKTFFRCNDQY